MGLFLLLQSIKLVIKNTLKFVQKKKILFLLLTGMLWKLEKWVAQFTVTVASILFLELVNSVQPNRKSSVTNTNWNVFFWPYRSILQTVQWHMLEYDKCISMNCLLAVQCTPLQTEHETIVNETSLYYKQLWSMLDTF